MAKLTTENKKMIGLGLIILILVVLIYINRDKPDVTNLKDKIIKPKPAPAPTNTDTTPKTDKDFNVQEAAPVYNDSFPLKLHSKGDRVKTLQQALNRIREKGLSHSYTPLVVDGDLGEKTYTAIITWVGTKYWGTDGLSESNYNAIMQQSTATQPGETSAPVNPNNAWWSFLGF